MNLLIIFKSIFMFTYFNHNCFLKTRKFVPFCFYDIKFRWLGSKHFPDIAIESDTF